MQAGVAIRERGAPKLQLLLQCCYLNVLFLPHLLHVTTQHVNISCFAGIKLPKAVAKLSPGEEHASLGDHVQSTKAHKDLQQKNANKNDFVYCPNMTYRAVSKALPLIDSIYLCLAVHVQQQIWRCKFMLEQQLCQAAWDRR